MTTQSATRRKTATEIVASLLLASVVGIVAVVLFSVFPPYASALIIAAFVAANIFSFVRQKIRRRLVLILLGLPLGLAIAVFIAIRLPIWLAPHPMWIIEGNRQLETCSQLIPALAGQRVQPIEANTDIAREMAYEVANKMILQVDWAKLPKAMESQPWYPSSPHPSLLQASLVSTQFPDSQQRLAWYIPIVTNRGHHGSSAVLAIAYVDARSGVPLMLITGAFVLLPSIDTMQPNGCPPSASNTTLSDLISFEYVISLQLIIYLWVIMLAKWLRK